jgi:TonB-linked SusC/RagA family outer membrane protein
MMRSFYQKAILIAWMLLQVYAGHGQATDFLVQGRVTDQESGESMPGVSVLLKGTSHGTITDAEGRYSLNVNNPNGVLVFSFIGFADTEVVISSRTQVNVSLAPSVTSLDEVVVIGYGEQSRATLTTAVSKIDEKEFKNAPSANPLVQLQGKVAGLSLQISDGQPGANPQIFIRGGASTSPESDSPLIIVNGVVGAMRNISDLNPDDIESIQVLKDAASTAIYGARAAFGVIIVKTKSGKVNARPTISFKHTSGIETQGKTYDFTSARDYIDVSRRNIVNNTPDPALYPNFNRNLFLSGGYGMSTGSPRNSRNTVDFLDNYIQNYGSDYVTDLIDNQGWETMTDPVTGRKLIFKETNYQDVTFQTAHRQEYDLSISGGTDKATYYASMGHLDQDGIVAGTWYKNYSFLLNTTYAVSDKLKFNADVTYQFRNSNGLGNYQNVLSRSVTMPFTYRLAYEDGTPAPGEGVTSFRNRNHEIYYRDKYNDNRVFRTTLSAGATWDILPELTFKPAVYWFTTEGIQNRFEAYNEVNINRNASAEHEFIKQGQVDAVLNYDKTFSAHGFNAVLGFSYINNYTYTLNGSGYGAPTDNIPTLNAVADTSKRISSVESADAIMSFFGRINYNYNQKYMLSASLRRDGSSKFASAHKWGMFPGMSAGWNMHSEDFWQPMSRYISAMKLRTSWGQTGNNPLNYSDTQGRYGSTIDIDNDNDLDLINYMGQSGILNSTMANGDLVWETTTSFDAGVDIGLFRNRVTLLLDYYNKLTSDRLFDLPIDATSGFRSIKANYGTLRSRGFEVELAANVLERNSFAWDVNFTFAYNRSTVVKLPDNGEEKNRIGGNTVYDPATQSYRKVGGLAEGERYGGRWAFHMIGVYATDADANGRTKKGGDAIWQDVDGNGRIDVEDMVFMGYIRPDKTGGIVNTFRYKGLSLRVVADYAVGHVIDNSFRGRSLASARNNNMTLTDVLGDKIWKQQGDIASIPRYTVASDADYGYRNHLRNPNGLGTTGVYSTNNSLYFSKGDFLALREVSLTYTLQHSLLQKIRLQGVDVFAGVYNLGYLTKYDGLMPEVYSGADQGSYPRPRQFNFGFKLTL